MSISPIAAIVGIVATLLTFVGVGFTLVWRFATLATEIQRDNKEAREKGERHDEKTKELEEKLEELGDTRAKADRADEHVDFMSKAFPALERRVDTIDTKLGISKQIRTAVRAEMHSQHDGDDSDPPPAESPPKKGRHR